MVREKPVTLKLMAPAPLPDFTAKPPAAGNDRRPAGTETPSQPAVANTTPAPASTQTPPPTPPTAQADPDAALNITLEQAKMLFDNGMVFLDARHLGEYEQGHIAGAFLLNTDTFATPGGGEVLGMLDRELPVVVYCQGGMCDASKNLVRLLQQSGYMGARIFHDGYPAWANAGYPTATGKPQIGGG